jgi:hypothetical protein
LFLAFPEPGLAESLYSVIQAPVFCADPVILSNTSMETGCAMSHKRNFRLGTVLIGWIFVAGLPASGFSAIRFDVVGSPTEVINTGRSEVLGSVALIVRGSGNVSGTAAGGAAQIGLIFSHPAVQIDNTTATGIRLFSSAGFAGAVPRIIGVENRDLGGSCAGFVTINIPPGSTLSDGDFLRIEGIRGRIDASAAVTAGTDIYVDLQSINDPAANLLQPDHIRAAKSLRGMNVEVYSDAFYYAIRVSEGFPRAFVDLDAGDDASPTGDRVDSGGALLGAPTNSTRFRVKLSGIPSGISGVLWPAAVADPNTGARLVLLNQSFSNPIATADYSFESPDQVGRSDVTTESFLIGPSLVFSGGSCDTGQLTAAVTLAPAVPGSAGCNAALDSAARPRFLEWYQTPVIINDLIPSYAVVGGSAFTLTVKGAGFAPGATVLWNAAARTTVFVDSSTLRASIPDADIAEVGTVTLTVENPADLIGQGVSNPAPFTIRAPNLALFVPRFVSTSGASLEATEYTGVALANLGGRTATLKFLAFERDGSLITGSGITNPAVFTLGGGQQMSLLDSQVFGSAFRASNRLGWVRIESDVPQLAGLALYMNGAKTSLESAGASSERSTAFIFPEVEGKSGQIQVANPAELPVEVTLELMGANGAVRATSAKKIVAGTGVLSASVSDLFPGVAALSTDYIRGVATSGVVSLEYLGSGSADARALNGQNGDAGATMLYASQFVTGSPDWESTLSIVNLSNTAGNVAFRFVGDDGIELGTPLVLPMQANGKLTVSSAALGAGLNRMAQGYVEVLGEGLPLSGAIAFTSPGSRRFASTVPLVSRLSSSMAFSQIASNTDYFTGVAIVNPAAAPAITVLQVFDANGTALASRSVLIPARGRIAGLIGQLFPDLAGLSLATGYVRVDSMNALAGMILLGANDLATLAAVPLQPLQ